MEQKLSTNLNIKCSIKFVGLRNVKLPAKCNECRLLQSNLLQVVAKTIVNV